MFIATLLTSPERPALERATVESLRNAWGGGDAINNVMKYIGPGFQLVSFDPKTSISMVGKEAFASEEALAEAAELNARLQATQAFSANMVKNAGYKPQ